jgi:endonuclease G
MHFTSSEKSVLHTYPLGIATCLVAVLFGLAPVRVMALIGAEWQMQLGNPSSTTSDTNNHAHYLSKQNVLALDFSDHRAGPNWVSWNLTKADIGGSERTGSFLKDANLPPNFTNVLVHDDYTRSGYDRGHQCPSKDRTASPVINTQAFNMSNVLPQNGSMNSGVWRIFEEECQSLAGSENELLIISGGGGYNGERITNNDMSGRYAAIPGYFWKIAVVVTQKTDDARTALNRIDETTRVIALKIGNVSQTGIRWTNFVTSANQLQDETANTFFSALPPEIAEVLRAKMDGKPPASIRVFSPTQGQAGTVVSILGTNFTGASVVKFANSTNAMFSVNSDTQVVATVPAGAVTGPLYIITPGGKVTSSDTFQIAGGAGHPGLVITNTVSTNGACPGSKMVQGYNDTPVTYCFYVGNTGDVKLTGVVMTNSAFPDQVWTLGELAPNASKVESFMSSITADLPNEAFVSGVDPVGNTVQASDRSEVDLIRPGIVITSTVSETATCPGTHRLIVPITTQVRYCFSVRNIGDVVLDNVEIKSSVLPSGSTFVGKLEPNQFKEVFEDSIVTVDLIDTVVAHGIDPLGNPVTSSDVFEVQRSPTRPTGLRVVPQ